MKPAEGVIAEIAAHGWAHLPETPQEQLEPTRPRSQHVDCMICDRRLRVHTQNTRRGRRHGRPRLVGTTLTQFLFKPRTAVTKNERVTEESSHEAFRKHESTFHHAETLCDADSMGTTSNLAQELLTVGLKGRAWSKEPKIAQCPDTGRDTDFCTVALRKLQILRNKALFAKQHPDKENVLRREIYRGWWTKRDGHGRYTSANVIHQ